MLHVWICQHLPTYANIIIHTYANICSNNDPHVVNYSIHGVYGIYILYPHVGWLYPHDIPELDGAYNRLGTYFILI